VRLRLTVWCSPLGINPKYAAIAKELRHNRDLGGDPQLARR